MSLTTQAPAQTLITRWWPGANRTVTVLLTVAAGLGVVAVPLTVQQVLDRVHRPGSGSGFVLVAVAAGIVVVLAATACAQVVEQRMIRRTEVLLHAVRTQAFQHLTERPGLSDTIQNAHTRRAVDDLDRASRVIRWTAPGLLLNVGRLLALTVAMALFSWQLTFVVLVGTTVFLSGQVWMWRRTRVVFRAFCRRELEVRSAIARLVLHARQDRAYDERRHAQARAEQAIEDRSKQRVCLARREAGSGVVGELGAGVVLAALILAGAHLGAQRQVTVEELVAVLLAFLLATSPMQAVVHSARDGLDALVRWRRIRRAYLGDQLASAKEPAD